MGAFYSKDQINGVSASSSINRPAGLEDIPENCISTILMFLDPPEICKLASLNRSFHSASSSDFIWESKLPSNYKFILNQLLLNHPQISLLKKDIYSSLTRPNLFHGGTKEVWLDKRSGKILVSISSMALKITGIDDRRYWNYISTDESRFESVAYLKQIWWVEIGGELEFEFPAGNYSLYFRLQLGKPSKKFGRRIAEIDQVHGWDLKPVRFQLSISNGQKAFSQCYLQEIGNWGFYHVGDFLIENPNFLTHIKFSMVQIDCTHTKGGLSVDSVLICPSQFKARLFK